MGTTTHREWDELTNVAKLYFRYGPMNSGKSTRLLQDAYNYEERGQTVAIMKPTVDTKDDSVLSRLGVSRNVDIHVTPYASVRAAFAAYCRDSQNKPTETGKIVDCLFVDEAQFLSPSQVDELFYIVIEMNIPVIAYGIRTDFLSQAFPGSLRLLEIAHSLDEMKTICRCGKKALFNARKMQGYFVSGGSQVAIDDGTVEYEPLCGHCYVKHVGSFPTPIALKV